MCLPFSPNIYTGCVSDRTEQCACVGQNRAHSENISGVWCNTALFFSKQPLFIQKDNTQCSYDWDEPKEMADWRTHPSQRKPQKKCFDITSHPRHPSVCKVPRFLISGSSVRYQDLTVLFKQTTDKNRQAQRKKAFPNCFVEITFDQVCPP